MEMEPGKLFIGGISWDTNEDRLREYFQTFGEVVEAVIMKDRNTGRARGFGFVVFADPSVAERVVREKHIIDGRTEYGIKGFPTIKVFVPGKPPVDYQGARDVKPIAEYALQQIKGLLKDRLHGKGTGASSEKSEPSASMELNSCNFDELVLKSKELWIVEFCAPWFWL